MAGCNNTSTPGNSTYSLNGPSWNGPAVLSAILTVLALTLNLPVLFGLIMNRSLWTPFNVYVVSLLSANVFYHSINGPVDLINDLYQTWWLGKNLCSLYQYMQYTASGVQTAMHVCIAINRLSAIVFPVSYRDHHNHRIAMLACAAAWAISHVITLPTVVLDHVYYRLPEEIKGCYIDLSTTIGQKVGGLVMELTTVISALIIFAQFPVAWWKTTHGVKRRGRRAAHAPTDNYVMAENHVIAATSVTASSDTTAKASQAARAGTTVNASDKPRRRQAFVLLRVLTITVFVFWTPSVTYFTMLELLGMDVFRLDVYTTVMVLYECQSVADPVIFVLSLPKLRAGISAAYRL